MLYFKQRIVALLIISIFAVILYLNWRDAAESGSYYLKMAIFAPAGIVMGVFLLFFPQFSGRPETTGAKIITLAVFAIGVLIGLYNWYLMDPRSFPF